MVNLILKCIIIYYLSHSAIDEYINKGCIILKNKLLKELKSQKRFCFTEILEKDNKIFILKSKEDFSSYLEIKEICEIQSLLTKYQDTFKIEIDLNKIIINL